MKSLFSLLLCAIWYLWYQENGQNFRTPHSIKWISIFLVEKNRKAIIVLLLFERKGERERHPIRIRSAPIQFAINMFNLLEIQHLRSTSSKSGISRYILSTYDTHRTDKKFHFIHAIKDMTKNTCLSEISLNYIIIMIDELLDFSKKRVHSYLIFDNFIILEEVGVEES